jgi:adenylate cyclase
LDAEDLAAVLNEYFSEMTTIAHRHGGTVEQFVGDAVMMLFGAPVFVSDQEGA